MQSLNYPGYKDSTELDMLAHLLTRHRLAEMKHYIICTYT